MTRASTMETNPRRSAILGFGCWLALTAFGAAAQEPSRATPHPRSQIPDPRSYDLVRVLRAGEGVDEWPPLASGGGIGVRAWNLSEPDSPAKIRLFAEYRYGRFDAAWELELRAIVVQDHAVAEIDCQDAFGDVAIFLGVGSSSSRAP